MSPRPAMDGALTGLEEAVCSSDQQLAALFALFNRLYQDEEMPAWERRRPGGLRLLAALLVPILLGWRLIVAGAVASRRAAGRACRPARRGLRRAAPGMRTPGPWRIPLEP